MRFKKSFVAKVKDTAVCYVLGLITECLFFGAGFIMAYLVCKIADVEFIPNLAAFLLIMCRGLYSIVFGSRDTGKSIAKYIKECTIDEDEQPDRKMLND